MLRAALAVLWLSSLEPSSRPSNIGLKPGLPPWRHNTHMNATQVNPEQLNTAQLQDHLYTLEERLFHPGREADRSALIPLFAEDFQEYCSSGRIYSRQQTIDDLMTSSPRPATISHFYVTRLAPDVALATYHATTTLHTSHRSSLWVFRDNRWQLLFHQGTVAS